MNSRKFKLAFSSLLALALSLSISCSHKTTINKDSTGATFEGEHFPDSKVVDGKTLLLNGVGPFDTVAYMMPVRLLAVALYVERPVSTAEEVKKGDQIRHLEYHVLDYDLPENDNVLGWQKSFRDACVSDCQNTEIFREFSEAIGGAEARKGRMYITLYPDDRVVLDVDYINKTNKTWKSKSLSQNIMALYWRDGKQKDSIMILGRLLLGQPAK